MKSICVALIVAVLVPSQAETQSDWASRFPLASQKRLRRLFDRAHSCTKLPIEFGTFDASYSNTSELWPEETRIVVRVRKNLTLATEENTIAHELYHIILTCQGYSHWVRVPPFLPEPEQALLLASGRETIDCVQDALIDKELKKLGFEPRILNHESLILTPFPKFSAAQLADQHFQQVNGLYLYCSYFRMKYRSDNTQEGWAKVSREVVAHADHLRTRVPDVTCSDPTSCFEKEKVIRGALGLSFKLENPVTKQLE